MANLKDVIYLSNEDYETLVSTGTVTIEGTTLTYDENCIYITPDKLVTTTEDGLMSCTDKAILDTINGAYIKNASVSNNTLTLTKQDGTTVTYTAASSDNQQTVKGNGTAFGANDAIDIKGSGIVSVSGNATNKEITISASHQSIKSLDTTATTAQSTSSSEAIAGSGTITLHKVSKTGSYNDLLNKPTIDNNNQKVKAGSVTFGANDVVDIVAGSNITVTGLASGTGAPKITIGNKVSVTSTSVTDGTNTFNKYTHPTYTEQTAGLFKIGRDSTGHVVIGDAFTIPQGTVTSVRVQATSPVQSSTSSAQSTTLNTTISLADAYGDTKNPYGSKTANYVLAAPNGSAGTPSFRALVEADLPATYVKDIGTVNANDVVSEKFPNNMWVSFVSYDGETRYLGKFDGGSLHIWSYFGYLYKSCSTTETYGNWKSAATSYNYINTSSTAQTKSGNLTLNGTTDVSGGTLKLKTINAPTTSGGTTYGAGSNGQILKSNGTTVYWASDSNSDTWRYVQVDGVEKLGIATNTGALNFVSQNTNNGDVSFTYSNGIKATAKVPTVNNATLTIQKNGTTVKTFTANASSDVTANITVPTKTSDLTNDSGYVSGPSSSTDNAVARFDSTTGKIIQNSTVIIEDNGDLKLGRYTHNVLHAETTAIPTETIIHTKIQYASEAYMPVIRIYGYAYGLKSPIELKLSWYIYGGNMGWCGAVSMGAWRPEIYIFKETVDGVDYIAIGLKGSCYYLGFDVDAQFPTNNYVTRYISTTGWSVTFNTSSTSVIPTSGVNVDENNAVCRRIPYKSTLESLTITANSSATSYDGTSAKSLNLDNIYLGKSAKAADSDKLDGNDSSYFQKALPTTTTANKVLLSTATSGTTAWSSWSSAGFLKTNASGVVSVDTNTYIINSSDNTTTATTKLSSSAAAAFTLKRTTSAGGVFIDYMPNNQETSYWRVGSFNDGTWGACTAGNQSQSIAFTTDRNIKKDNNYTYTLPNKTGTIALISDIPDVPPVNNGALTIKGNNTTAATFTANQSNATNLNFAAGNNVTITGASGTITIAADILSIEMVDLR